MTWLLAIALALAAFALAAFALRVGRQSWTTFAAALALGLAGYALQASPGVPGAPTAGRSAAFSTEAGFAFVEARKEMVAERYRSTSAKLLIADGLARQGQFSNSAAMLRGAASENPRDGEAWLALGNVLVEHANGALTQPALLAYRRADATMPGSAGPGYFLGLALIRQGRLMEARGVWAATLESASEDAAGRAALEQRLARLDQIIAGQGPVPQSNTPSR